MQLGVSFVTITTYANQELTLGNSLVLLATEIHTHTLETFPALLTRLESKPETFQPQDTAYRPPEHETSDAVSFPRERLHI